MGRGEGAQPTDLIEDEHEHSVWAETDEGGRPPLEEEAWAFFAQRLLENVDGAVRAGLRRISA